MRRFYRHFYLKLFNRFVKQTHKGTRVTIEMAYWNPLFWLWLALPVPGLRRGRRLRL